MFICYAARSQLQRTAVSASATTNQFQNKSSVSVSAMKRKFKSNIGFFVCNAIWTKGTMRDSLKRTAIQRSMQDSELSLFRVFLNLWFGKPMVCVRVAFHENDGNHENDENDEDNSDSYKQGFECWNSGNHGNHENDENHGNPGCKPRVPQTTGLETPDYLRWDGTFHPIQGMCNILPTSVRP